MESIKKHIRQSVLTYWPKIRCMGQCLDSDCGTAEALCVEDSEATPHIDFSRSAYGQIHADRLPLHCVCGTWV